MRPIEHFNSNKQSRIRKLFGAARHWVDFYSENADASVRDIIKPVSDMLWESQSMMFERKTLKSRDTLYAIYKNLNGAKRKLEINAIKIKGYNEKAYLRLYKGGDGSNYDAGAYKTADVQNVLNAINLLIDEIEKLAERLDIQNLIN